jgi:hypothetical protein
MLNCAVSGDRKAQIRQVERSRLSPFKASDWVGTILASLGVAFRFLTLAGQADAQTLGGILRSPAHFSVRLATQGWTCRSQTRRLSPIVLLRHVLINAQIAAGYALTLRLRHGGYLD